MKYFFLVSLIAIISNIDSNAQNLTAGLKQYGGITFLVANKSCVIAAENILRPMTWEEGKKACEELTLNGYDDWRLPTKKEISNAYYELFVSNIMKYPTGFYWTKSENKGINLLAWCFDFKDGQEYNSHSKANSYYILPVRTHCKK